MTDYTKTVDFTAKDALAIGDPNKRAKGQEVDTELDNIAAAIATKADVVASPVANDILKVTSAGDPTGAGFAMPNVSDDIDASHTEINEVCDASEGATSGYKKLRFAYFIDSNKVSSTVIDIASAVSASTWTDIVPSSGGTVWSALQDLPSSAKAIKVRIVGSAVEGSSGDQASVRLTAGDYGLSLGVDTSNRIFTAESATNLTVSTVSEVTLNVDSSQRFAVYWTPGAGDSSHTLEMYLVGWYE